MILLKVGYSGYAEFKLSLIHIFTDQYKRFNNRTYETTSAYFNTVEILFLKYLDYLDNLDE